MSTDLSPGFEKEAREPAKGSMFECPLAAPVNTASALRRTPMVGGSNIYFGTGLATRKDLGTSVPFDALMMLLLAEYARRRTGGRKIYHEISDTHALATRPESDAATIVAMAQDQKRIYTQAATSLGLGQTYECIRASSYQRDPRYRLCLADVADAGNAPDNDYVSMQSAGNMFFARTKWAYVKVGWLTDDNEDIRGADERWFNAQYDTLGRDPMSFIYGFSGLTFDPARVRVSPYTMVAGEKRLTLLPNGVPAAVQLQEMMCGGNAKINARVIAHYTKLIAAIDDLTGSRLSGPAGNLRALGYAIDHVRDHIGARLQTAVPDMGMMPLRVATVMP